MSKERLEEIKKRIEFHKDWAKGTHYAEVNYEELMEFEWLSKQVQELDKELEQREIDSMEAHYRNKNHVSELKEHNNRYREYFQKVINTDERLVDKQYFKDLANEALEESE